ncbi:fungal-specific transcription factor domain protein [Xylona heveae TC161]|uniref:Fungal-specific transcription factor domain protein n=1 Tax=Xylona heveae (strain CBS 132557 / TC161) TaxID=1328760 RepID=A0A161TE31_XYLHT|nr:fungal-specific transcription factor domain protein [Xylona heveae TC161]KZF24167.1 fungal-specific transcription factor domain protein [Xylona heveae TC161]
MSQDGMTPQATTPLMNPPPQVFGRFTPGGSPISPVLSGPIFPQDASAQTSDEHNDGKRRRIARACDMCRKKKIKCDGKLPACTHCLNYKTECIFTQVEKKRNPPKGAKYIEGLENRLGRMESLLKLSGLLSETDGNTDLGTLEKRLADKAATSNGTPPRASEWSAPQRSSTESQREPSRQPSFSSPPSRATTPESEKEDQEEVEALSDMMCSLVTNNCGETRYIGSSSGFSIFSPKGIQWVNEKTGDSSFQDMISSATVDDSKWMLWKPEVFGDIFGRRLYISLPPKEEALSLLKDYFENFNCMFPLFHEPTFMHLVERQYSRDPFEGSGWWASLNVVLAIAHRLRIMSNLVPQDEDQKAWAHLKNALAVFTELTLRNADLLSVQAMLGMALFLQGTPNPQPCYFLVAAAFRMAHSIGLHKRGSGFNLNPVEIEQRKRVFWIAYLIDKDISLRSGRPPVQDDDDMSVELPSEDPADNIGNIPLADGKSKINLFRLICTFAIIEGKVYKQLYSTKAAKQSDGELLNTIGELDRELEEWKDAIPVDIRPGHEINSSHTPLILHIVVLHFAYHNCLTTIHRMSVHHGYWTSRLSNFAIQGLNSRPLNPRVFSSANLCVSSARTSIHLIRYIPQGDYACVWLILYYPVAALVTLFANILQNPQDARARSDIKLMDQVVTFLSNICTDDQNGGAKRMLNVCTEFERIAKVVVDKADAETSNRKKRKDHHEERPKSTAGTTPAPQSKATPVPEAARTPAPTSGTSPYAFMGAPTPGVPFTPELTASVGTPAPHTSSSQPSTNGYSPQVGESHWLPDFSSSDMPNILSPGGGVGQDFANMTASYSTPGPFASPAPFSHPGSIPNGVAAPFVPQDLWQLPMSLEWDWTDISSFGYPPFDQTMGGGGGGGGGGSASSHDPTQNQIRHEQALPPQPDHNPS